MDRGRRQLHAMPRADGAELRRALEDFRRRGRVVVLCSGDRTRRQHARVEDAAGHHANAAVQTQRQECIGRALVEQGVAAGEQHAINVAALGEADADIGLVHADAGRADDAFAPELRKRAPGAGDSFLDPLINGVAMIAPVDVMDQRDLHMADAEAQQRLLDRAHRAVIAVVECRGEGQPAGVSAGRVGAPRRRHPAPDLRRQNDRVAVDAAERSPQAVLGETVAVERRRIEQRDAADGRGHGCVDGLPLVQTSIQIAERRRSKAQRRHHEACPAEQGDVRFHRPCGQSFSPPAERPATISRWASTVSSSTGSVTSSAAAASGPQEICSKVSEL